MQFIAALTALIMTSHQALAAFPPIDEKWANPQPSTEHLSTMRGSIGARGMVAADDREAAEWGVEILRRGGNAIDAAVATAFMMAVTRPQYAALGGGGFLVYCPPKKNNTPGSCVTIDFREKSPKAAHRNLYVVDGQPKPELAQEGALASGVPGVPSGLLLALEKFGKLKRKQILTLPIQIAQNGFRISGRTQSLADVRWSTFNREAKRLFGCFKKNTKVGEEGLEPCPPGHLIRQPELARVLTEIEQKGKSGFYRGWVAEKITTGLKSAGGIMTMSDLAAYEAKFRDPIVAPFGPELELVSMGPPSSGGAIVAMAAKYAALADASGEFDEGPLSARTLHAQIHALSLAFADRAQHFGDPDQVSVPLTGLLDPTYLEKRWKETFKRKKANIPASAGSPLVSIPLPTTESQPGMNTTHLSAVDKDGGAVSITVTVNHYFGSGFVPPGTGIVMNNQMDDFAIQPGVPNIYGLIGAEANAVGPEKRPLSSMSPTIVRDRTGENRMVIGAEGGPRIASSTFIALLHRIRFGLSIADSVIAPRVHHQWRPQTVFVEPIGTSHELTMRLKKMGYTIEDTPDNAYMHAIERFPSNGRVWGIADPRSQGGVAFE